MNITQKTVVTAIIIQNNKILLQKRTDNIASHKDKWTTPSGAVAINEHPIDAVKREVLEETGVKIDVIQMLPVVDSFPNHKNTLHLIYLSFLCRIVDGIPTNIDGDDDISDLRWIEIDKLKEIELIRGTMPPIEFVLNNNLQMTLI